MKIIYLPKDAFKPHDTEFHLIEFDVHRGMVMTDDGHCRHRTKIALKLNLGGHILEDEIRLHPTEDPNALPSKEPKGPYDLLQELLVRIIGQRWPQIANFLAKDVVVNNITVHEIHPDGEPPYVSAIWQSQMGISKKRTFGFSTACESQDSIRAIVLALIAAYQLIVYRWLLLEETRKRVEIRRLMNHPLRPNVRRRKRPRRML